MRGALRVAFVAACVSAVALGCSGKKDEGGGSGRGATSSAKTPKEAVANMNKAIETMDKDLFLSTVYFGENGKEMAEALFYVTAAMMGFGKDMENAYGKDAGADFTKDGPILTADELAKLEIKEEGDKATAKNPKGGRDVSLVKKDGAWKLDMTEEIPDAERLEFIKEHKAMLKAISDARAKIGKPGMTKKKINEEFGKAMRATMSEK